MHGRTWLQAKQLEWQYFARKEERTKEKIETAKRLRSMGMTDEQIQFATQLSLEDIKTL